MQLAASSSACTVAAAYCVLTCAIAAAAASFYRTLQAFACEMRQMRQQLKLCRRGAGSMSLQMAATWRVVSGLVNALSCCFSAPLQSSSSPSTLSLSLLPRCHHASSVVVIPTPHLPSATVLSYKCARRTPPQHLSLFAVFFFSLARALQKLCT